MDLCFLIPSGPCIVANHTKSGGIKSPCTTPLLLQRQCHLCFERVVFPAHRSGTLQRHLRLQQQLPPRRSAFPKTMRISQKPTTTYRCFFSSSKSEAGIGPNPPTSSTDQDSVLCEACDTEVCMRETYSIIFCQIPSASMAPYAPVGYFSHIQRIWWAPPTQHGNSSSKHWCLPSQALSLTMLRWQASTGQVQQWPSLDLFSLLSAQTCFAVESCSQEAVPAMCCAQLLQADTSCQTASLSVAKRHVPEPAILCCADAGAADPWEPPAGT